MTDPALFDADGRTAIRIERFLPHDLDLVWEAVTRPEHLKAWFPTEVTIELEPGGVVRYQWDGGPADGADPRFGEVLAIEPPHLLAFTWGADHLRFELAAEPGGTRFVLEHAFDDRAGAASFAAGWEACLAALAPVLADEPTPAPDRMIDRHEELVTRFQLDRPTVTEAPRLLAFDVAPGEPGEHLRFELVEGTGHGARLVLTVRGTTARAGDREAAEEQWGRGAIDHIAEQAAAWAHAHAEAPTTGEEGR